MCVGSDERKPTITLFYITLQSPHAHSFTLHDKAHTHTLLRYITKPTRADTVIPATPPTLIVLTVGEGYDNCNIHRPRISTARTTTAALTPPSGMPRVNNPYLSEARIILAIMGSQGNSAMRRPSLVSSPRWLRAPSAYSCSSASTSVSWGGGSMKSKLIRSLIPSDCKHTQW